MIQEETRSQRWRRLHPEAAIASTRKSVAKWRRLNPEKFRASVEVWEKKNKMKVLLSNRKSNKKWRQSNLSYDCARVAEKRALKYRATPFWADREEIRKIYVEARNFSLRTGIKHHVDHIYPLKHENFVGLHVSWNLRILPATINSAKGNRVPPELLRIYATS